MSVSISKAAQRLGSSPDTLRYYEKIGLVRPARTAGGRRVFDRGDLDQLRFIRRAQDIGFTLAEIEQLLKLRRDPARCSKSVRDLAAGKVAELGGRLEALKRMHDELTLLLGLCSAETENCPILDSLEADE